MRNVSAMRSLYLPTLDGFRAVAVGIVFLSHVPISELSPIPGGFGVTIFFVLSGYLITTLLVREHDRSGTVDIKAFVVRRALRILPPLYVALAVGVLLHVLGVVDAPHGLSGIWSQILHFSNYYVAGGGEAILDGTEVTWSLAVEEHFYLLYPFVFALLYRRVGAARTAAFLVVVAGAVLAWRLVYAGGVVDEATFFELAYRTDFRIDSILWGCVLALAMNPMERTARRFRTEELLLGVLAVLLAATILPQGDWYKGTVRFTLQPVLLMGVFWIVVSNPRLLVHRVFESRPMKWLGKVSYTLYLTSHAITIVAFREIAGVGWRLDTDFRGSGIERELLLAFVVSVVGSLLVAWLMERLIERPLLGVRRRWRTAETHVPGPFDDGADQAAWFDWVPSVLPPVDGGTRSRPLDGQAIVPAPRPAVPRPGPRRPLEVPQQPATTTAGSAPLGD